MLSRKLTSGASANPDDVGMDDDTKKLLLVGGLGVLGVGLLAWAVSTPQSNVQVNPGPLPPARRPADLPPPADLTPAEAAAAAIAAALGGAGAGVGPQTPGTTMQPQIPSGLILPDPALLIQGQRYKARLQLSGLEGLASRDMVKNSFQELGFSNVVVYTNRNEVPPGWPQAALANADNGSRWAEGTWTATTQTVAKPRQIQNAWTA